MARQKRVMRRLKGKYTKVVRSAPRPTKVFLRRNTLNPRTGYKAKLNARPRQMFVRSMARRQNEGKHGAPFVDGFSRKIKQPKWLIYGKERYKNSIFADISGRRTMVNGPLAVAKLQAAIRGRQERAHFNSVGKQRRTWSRNRRFRPSY